MLRIDYTIIWPLNDPSEQTDSLECIWHWVDEDTTTSEILEKLWEDVRDYGGSRAWLGSWEVSKE